MQLPRKMSKLIEIALADLSKVERSKRYAVKMDLVWHSPMGNRCVVCFGGAVMAKSLNIAATDQAIPPDFADNCDQLFALHYLQRGDVYRAASTLGIDPTRFPERVKITPYRRDKTKFKRQMRQLAAKLRRARL